MAWNTLADSRLMRLTEFDIRAQTFTTMSQVDLDLASNLNVALFDNNVTPAVDATTTLSTYTGASSVWQAAGGQTGGNQVFHTGQWAQGGITVPSTALSVVAGGIVQFTSGNLVSGSAATMSNIRGMMIYFQAATGGGQTKPVLGYWYFGGTDYAVTAGTLTITPNANGLYRITL